MMRFKMACFLLGCFPILLQAGEPIFNIRLAKGETAFPHNMDWYGFPATRFLDITNQSTVTMPVAYTLPAQYVIDKATSSCGSVLKAGESCKLAVVFNPDQRGHFSGHLKVCGFNALWCSVDPQGFDVTVTNNVIVSSNCETIQSRPFAKLDCAGSQLYAQNFYSFLASVLHANAPASAQSFNYYQHKPSVDETTTPCLLAHQKNVDLDPAIQGGGVPLCGLMGYASSNSASKAAVSKQYPPYLTLLLGTSYPITPTTTALDKLPQLLATFGQSSMDPFVQHLGYDGYVNFLNNYYLQQMSTPYANCGESAVCPSLYYLPYSSEAASLENWPPRGMRYWGMSGGGGSGAGYQIQAFKPGSEEHYTLFSGGGGGGGGNTTPEDLNTLHISLLNTGSGGGGGSQFAECYVTKTGNLNGLGLGSGTGAGLSAVEGRDISFQPPPPTEYSYYPPNTHPTWSDAQTLLSYGDNLAYLFNTLLPKLYNEGYTITITGGGGGGTGLEFLNAMGEEYQPHPLSIGYGFNFCYVFNKAKQYTPTDCISSSTPTPSSATIDNIVYQNMGTIFNKGMNLAVKACKGGYSNFQCTCTFQHAYVVCQLTDLLVANGFSSADVPTWLINPHCNESVNAVQANATLIEQLPRLNATNHCAASVKTFYQAKTATMCMPPWV